MNCEDCNQRPAEYRIRYTNGRTFCACAMCGPFVWHLVELHGTGRLLERLEDGEVLQWGRQILDAGKATT